MQVVSRVVLAGGCLSGERCATHVYIRPSIPSSEHLSRNSASVTKYYIIVYISNGRKCLLMNKFNVSIRWYPKSKCKLRVDDMMAS